MYAALKQNGAEATDRDREDMSLIEKTIVVRD